ncbi:MAG: hypothetical protein U0231_14450 [Nitrospiraceae bacterium]
MAWRRRHVRPALDLVRALVPEASFVTLLVKPGIAELLADILP